MSRLIDQWPTPAKVRPVKVIVASPSRSGTLGLYSAMQILGFRPYHLYECILVHGLSHMRVFKEAIIAQYNRMSGVKRYTRPDFEKWIGDYDCLVEIPSYLGKNIFEAYANDPEVKFILTERRPDSWARSLNNSAGGVVALSSQFPFNILKHFDATLHEFLEVNCMVYSALSGCTKPGDPDNEKELISYYDDIKMAKETIPADRLCIIKLEEGLGWEQICPFLGLPIPEEEYPDRNGPERFKRIVENFLKPHMLAATLRLGAVTLPALGVLGWASMKYGPSLLATLNSSL
ncbi:hypothetical protein N7462_002597 [Penicillium macrosclerotiorum]|uniref:uncharacterized protein n=1 Tax=Penicillium macrosclerotiorum TaxID=303699 RepID=UPI0025489852|nr:uncharacterized protein N7462_002597 [Penicillium macrosclerotiorum]KAJ5693174.1 hypothetical protein N7462_002597 [Penicillium macrosclerotiorum]